LYEHSGLAFRFITGYYLKEKWNNRTPTFDPFFSNVDHPNRRGPPIGGIGSGVITRSWQGDFTRWGLKAGLYHNAVIPVNQFSMYSKRQGQEGNAIVLNQSKDNPQTNLNSWNWWKNNNVPLYADMTGDYHAIYPRSWYSYNQPANQLKLTCTQFSPVIAHNYKESSYPVGVFDWNIENTGDTEIEVSIMFTFQNGTGTQNDRQGGHQNISFVEKDIHGVNMSHQLRYTSGEVLTGQVSDQLTFTIAGQAENGVGSTVSNFDPTCQQHNKQLWNAFAKNGTLDDVKFNGFVDGPSRPRQTLASAVCIKVTIPAKSTKQVTFSLSWDLPITRCGLASHYKRYTKYYGKERTAEFVSQQIAIDALTNYKTWLKEIESWQEPILSDETIPDWYKSLLFNELYYVVDGGTVWTNGSITETEPTEHFSYLEGHEYVMFTTYDVHFYASNALIVNWPEIQLCIQRDFAKASEMEHEQVYKWCGTGTNGKRKLKNTIPHDLGTTCENPWTLVNAYNVQNTNRWKDLNCHFVLTCFRDYSLTQNLEFLKHVWPRIESVVKYHMEHFDKDGDDLIENEGYPDSTYDVWTTTGPSAYCGGLWISSLAACEQIARILEEDETKIEFYKSKKERATKVYEEKLWNEKGGYYNYDSDRTNVYSDTVMSDQLAGHVMLRLCNMEPILNHDRIISSLKRIFELNVVKYTEKTGLGGACNGMRPNGEIDNHFMQCREVWTGTTYLLAATLMAEGLREEALTTAQGIHDVCWQKLGYWFQTPEAYDEKGGFRSAAYMRPLSIWAIEIARKAR
jgi:non-lysosomal glucosylceramidase